MRISNRFLLPTAGLALLCGAIVWPRWLNPQRHDTCARPDVLGVTGLIEGSEPGGERRSHLTADTIQWSEGLIPDASFPRDPMVFRIVRSYRVLKTAEHPVGMMPVKVEPETMRLELVDTPEGTLPVHVMRSSGRELFHIVAYSFVFGNEPVASPFLAQLRGTLRELREGRRPLTIFLAGGAATPETAPQREKIALRWIASAWQHYRGMCFDGGLAHRPRPGVDGGVDP
jgi:hypothetical protein